VARDFKAASEVGWKEKLAQLNSGGGDGAAGGRPGRDGVLSGSSRKGMISRRG